MELERHGPILKKADVNERGSGFGPGPIRTGVDSAHPVIVTACRSPSPEAFSTDEHQAARIHLRQFDPGVR
jgi:hypothetical protein